MEKRKATRKETIEFAKAMLKRMKNNFPNLSYERIEIMEGDKEIFAIVKTNMPCDSPLYNCDGKLILKCAPDWGTKTYCEKCKQ